MRTHTPGVQCTSVFKDTSDIRKNFSQLWADVINTLENPDHIGYNGDKQSHAHLLKVEVSGQ